MKPNLLTASTFTYADLKELLRKMSPKPEPKVFVYPGEFGSFLRALAKGRVQIEKYDPANQPGQPANPYRALMSLGMEVEECVVGGQVYTLVGDREKIDERLREWGVIEKRKALEGEG